MKCGQSGKEVTEANLSNVRERNWGRTAACPYVAGSVDRIQIWAPGKGKLGRGGMWCRVCKATEFVDNGENKNGQHVAYQPPKESKIDPALPGQMHANLGEHRNYFKSRGISDFIIDEYLLGWSEKKRRYAIPGFHNGKISGIQYRVSSGLEKWLLSKNLEVIKYISETGGINNIMFNERIAELDVPYVLIDESPLDVLMYLSLGFPAVSPFFGNNKSVGWRPEWNKFIRHIPEIIIIKQNDDNADLITAARLNDLHRGRVIVAPSGFKDGGEMVKVSKDPVRDVSRWLMLPPVITEEVWHGWRQ